MQHVIIKHSTWFVNEYGSLAAWSIQAMEKSHYQCKTVFVKHTQHRGGVKRHSAIIQTFESWYQIIQHQELDIHDRKSQEDVNATVEALIESRRQRQLNSNSREKHTTCLVSCVRDKNRWVPNLIPRLDEVVVGVDEVVVGAALNL